LRFDVNVSIFVYKLVCKVDIEPLTVDISDISVFLFKVICDCKFYTSLASNDI